MYDTMKVWLDTLETCKLEAVLTDYQERVNPKTGDLKQWGELKGLRVRAGGRGIVIEGSLPKYLFGNNLETLTRRATQEAIKSLSDDLHLPVERARVCRFDVAQNFLMKRPVIEYLSALNGARYYKRSDFADRETVTFHNTQRSLCFYDKALELEKKKEGMPDYFKGKNILRYESRFQKRLGKQFGRRIVTVENLFDEIFYMKPIKKWSGEYFLIQKIRKERALCMKGQREYLESLAFYGLQNIGGVDVALDLIRGARERGEIGKKTGQRLRKLTFEIAQARAAGSEQPADDCIEELDNKVRQAANYYR